MTTSYHLGQSGLAAFEPDLTTLVDVDGFVHLPGSDWRDATLSTTTRMEYEADEDLADDDWAERCEQAALLTGQAEKAVAKWNEDTRYGD